jgi:hypothetical protein
MMGLSGVWGFQKINKNKIKQLEDYPFPSLTKCRIYETIEPEVKS